MLRSVNMARGVALLCLFALPAAGCVARFGGDRVEPGAGSGGDAGVGGAAGSGGAACIAGTTSLDHFALSGMPATAVEGTPVSLTVEARTACDDPVPDYTGTIRFIATDARAQMPADYTFTAGDTAVRTFVNGVSFWTQGSQFVSVYDGAAAGTHAPVTVTDAPVGSERLWSIGGWSDGEVVHADVWSTADGVSWQGPAFELTDAPAAAIYNGQIWIAGGELQSAATDRVWASPDGIVWTLIGTLPEPRAYGRMVVYNNQLWFIGGYQGSSAWANVWVSTDGAAWTVAGTLPEGRDSVGLIAWNGELWVIGGWYADAAQSTVWTSTDGNSWQTLAPLPAPRFWSGVASFNNRLWVAAGATTAAPQRDVWSTVDGSSWTPEISLPEDRDGGGLATFGGDLWFVGGRGGSSDVLRTTDGTNWVVAGRLPDNDQYGVLLTTTTPEMLWVRGAGAGREAPLWRSSDGSRWGWVLPEARAEACLVGFQNRLWLLGGYGPGYVDRSNVWSSADGVGWIAEAPLPSARHGAAALVFGGAIFFVGGESASAPTDVVITSLDGVSWSSAGRLPDVRKGLSLVEHGGAIWVAAGKDSGGTTTSVWRSNDGNSWQVIGDLPAGRTHGALASHAGALWYAGGESDTAESTRTVWSSGDGIAWNNQPDLPGPRAYHTMVSWQGRLWLLGGYQSSATSTVWSSVDGSTWTTEASLPAVRDSAAVTAFALP